MKTDSARRADRTRDHFNWPAALRFAVPWGVAGVVLHLAGRQLHAVRDLGDAMLNGVALGLIGGLAVTYVRRHRLAGPLLRIAKAFLLVVFAATVVVLSDALAGLGREVLVVIAVSVAGIGLARLVSARRHLSEFHRDA